MVKKKENKVQAKIESLTKNLLECYEELDLIHRVSLGLMSTLDIRKIVNFVLSEAMEKFEAEVGWLYLPQTNDFPFDIHRLNIDEETVRLVNSIVVKDLIKRGKSKLFYNLQVELALLEKEVPGPFLCSLLKKENEIYGALCLGRYSTDNIFSAGDLKLANILSTQTASSLENYRLYQNIETLYEKQKHETIERKQQAEKLQNALNEVESLKSRLQAENIYLQEEIKVYHNFEEIISHNKRLMKVLRDVEQVASTEATVLILGETGTGKELLARAIHSLSLRSDRPLVTVNCAALPANLVESELFGHEKGAFTGALSRKIGRFELADGGTVFLDEVGELPLELQAKLLRVLQQGEFERLGSTHTVKVNVRLIAASNRDLEKAVAEGHFREDLFYRLNVFPINIPPLRERKNDIPLLVQHFVSKYGTKAGKKIDKISQSVMDTLQAYHWPGNVRELENIIERAVIISRENQLELGDWLPKVVASPNKTTISPLEENEREHIIKALEITGWRVSGEKGAAKILRINPKTLQSRMRKLSIHRQP